MRISQRLARLAGLKPVESAAENPPAPQESPSLTPPALDLASLSPLHRHLVATVEAHPIPSLVSELVEKAPPPIDKLAAAVLKALKMFTGITPEKAQEMAPQFIAAIPRTDLYAKTQEVVDNLSAWLAETDEPETETVAEETVGASLEPTVATDRDIDNRTDDISHSPIQPNEPNEPSASAEPRSHRSSRRRTRDGVRDNGERQERASQLADAPLAGEGAELPHSDTGQQAAFSR